MRGRTRDLERTLDLLNQSNARLSLAMTEAEAARADLADAIESVREGFALFGSDDRLVLTNSRFCETLPDLRAHLVPGLRFVEYIRRAAASPHLALPDGRGPPRWMRERLRHHRLPSATFNVQTAADRWVQVSEQRTPGGGTAILQTDITELIRLERQEHDKLLDEQAILIRATLDHVDQGIAIFDAGRRLVGWNTRLRDAPRPADAASPRRPRLRRLRRPPPPPGRRRRARRPRRLGRARAPGPARARPPHPRAGRASTSPPARCPTAASSSASPTSPPGARPSALEAANEGLEARVREVPSPSPTPSPRPSAPTPRSRASSPRRATTCSSRFPRPSSFSPPSTPPAPAGADLALGASAAPSTASRASSAPFSTSRGSTPGRARSPSRRSRSTRSSPRLGGESGRWPSRRGSPFASSPAARGAQQRGLPPAIVQNLLANAVNYGGRGKVLLGARRLPGAVRIEVWDTGPGIPEAEREAVFREFRRLPGSQATSGLGLGLAIVERACTLLRHPVELVSVEGRGTGFRVTVPLADALPANGPAPGPDGAAAFDPGSMTVLLVENEPVAAAFATLLEAWGVGALDRAGTEEAMALLDDLGLAPDVILADYHLDDGADGLAAIAGLRARHGPIPAMLVTADRTPEVAALCAAAGVSLMNKPVQTERLRDWLASVAR